MSTYYEAALISEISGADCHIAPLSRVTPHEVQPYEDTTCSHGIPLKQMFLVLAPVMSSSYPAQPSESRNTSVTTTAKNAQSFDVEPVKKERRSSSISSSASGKYRFLKLGPVHFGGEPGEHDYVGIQEE